MPKGGKNSPAVHKPPCLCCAKHFPAKAATHSLAGCSRWLRGTLEGAAFAAARAGKRGGKGGGRRPQPKGKKEKDKPAKDGAAGAGGGADTASAS